MHHLEQFKTSIDVVINQEKEYEQNFKRYAIKEIELKQKDSETFNQWMIWKKKMWKQIEEQVNDYVTIITNETQTSVNDMLQNLFVSVNNLKKPKNDEKRDFISLCHQSFLSQQEDEKILSTEEQKQLEEMIELWKSYFWFRDWWLESKHVSLSFQCFQQNECDHYAFLFTFRNNGRIQEGNEMMKFDINQWNSEHMFCLSEKDRE